MSRIKPIVMAELIERCGYYCEACGGPLDSLAIHHRFARRAGGSRLPWIDTAVNLMVVHGGLSGGCHNLTEWSIHQNPERSRRLFHIIPMGETPFSVPAPIVVRSLRELRS